MLTWKAKEEEPLSLSEIFVRRTGGGAVRLETLDENSTFAKSREEIASWYKFYIRESHPYFSFSLSSIVRDGLNVVLLEPNIQDGLKLIEDSHYTPAKQRY